MDVGELTGRAPLGVDVTSIATEQHLVRPGAVFFCRGGAPDRDLARCVAALGAVGLVVERRTSVGIPEVVVPSVEAALPAVAARLHGHPSHGLSVVGVTGTNGKGTTTFLIRALLESAGTPCGLLGGVSRVIGGRERESLHTTPGAHYLQLYLRAMVEGGDRACVMEVSSHALAQRRCDQIRFAAAVFTNMTPDHLEYHRSVRRYFAAKRRLFRELAPAVSVVGVDDRFGRRLAAQLERVVTFSLEGSADYVARAPRPTADGTEFDLVARDRKLRLRTRLRGRFNVANALAAAATAAELGVDDDALARGLEAAGPPPGRFERLTTSAPFDVIVDYAHTPAALGHALAAAREHAHGRLICVFGCAGGRDAPQRPRMGALARRLADVVVVTSDNPNGEDAEAIVAEVAAAVGSAAERIVDRPRAIARAFDLARPGDVVLIAGKGHERTTWFEGGLATDADIAHALCG
jgi:UDP-N-acetylmuramoyl-L-alanyl-D-glutamate--2,6-diaminopimelate ligase